MASAEVTMIPQTYVELTDEQDLNIALTRFWICWMQMMMYSRYIITGTSNRFPLQ